MTRPGIEPRSHGPLSNTLTPRPMSGINYSYNDINNTGDLRTLADTKSYENPSANNGLKTLKQIIIIIIIMQTMRWQRRNNHSHNKQMQQIRKEYKNRHDRVGRMIHWEMCKKFKFDHTNKCYMHNPASDLKNYTHKLLWEFDIQTDHVILARRPDLIVINNKKGNLQNCRLCCPGWPQNKTGRNWKEG